MTEFTVLGSPDDRRVEGFTAACRAEGVADPRVIPWTSLLQRTVRPPRSGLLRIESPGGDPDADTLLRGPGDPARVGDGARWYATFTDALDRLRRMTPAAVTWLSDPADIAVMFDKRLTHARLLAAGVPVPPALDRVITDYPELRSAMAVAGWSRVFVKPAHGSSASGVIALQARAGRVRAVTPSVPGPDGGYLNSLRVATYTDEPSVAELVDYLAPDGLHVERWMPKAGLNGRTFDLRVVVIGGTPTHVVARTSQTPMTNLHLGGQRGDLGEVRARLGQDRWRHALDVCSRAAACFPDTLMIAVDLLVTVGLREFFVAEVNAFGDLLPGLTGLDGGPAEGLDTYAAQVRAAVSARPALQAVHT